MLAAKQLRWAVSLSQLEACENFELFYRKAVQYVTDEECNYHRKFAYRDDSLACLVSRLLYRQFAVTVTDCRWAEVQVRRSARGKPWLAVPQTSHQFNISHQGDLVVLASHPNLPIGVDVMRIDQRNDETADSHREKMSRLFTQREHNMMSAQRTEREKWTAFYRIWCLKEAVLKATGTGLVNDLKKLEFLCKNEEKHAPGCMITSTEFHEDGVRQPNWVFEESFIGVDHTVAVGFCFPDEQSKKEALTKNEAMQFQWINWSQVVDNAEIINPLDDEAIEIFEEYQKKKLKHF